MRKEDEEFTAEAGEELLVIGDWLLGEENGEAASSKGSASVSLAVSRILQDTFYYPVGRCGLAAPILRA